jgi:hypothetical protein
MNEINNLKTKIQDLIDKAVGTNNHQKTLLNFLFKKLEEVKELETLLSLREYEGGKYLKAFLLYRSLIRANYQPEHLKLTKLDDTGKCLQAISRDIEELEKGKGPKELTNQQLLTLLGERIAQGEIKSDANHDYLYVADENFNKIITMVVEDGRIKPNPAEEFLKKYGLKGAKK